MSLDVVLTYIESGQDQEQNKDKVLLVFPPDFFGTWTSKPIHIRLLIIGPSQCSKDVGVFNNETFLKAFTQGRRMYCDVSEYDFPHVASDTNTLDAVCSVLDEDGKGGYRLDRMTFKDPFDILGFAPSIHEWSGYCRKRRRTARTHEAGGDTTGSSKPNRNSLVGAY
jgi:hypothetical protein